MSKTSVIITGATGLLGSSLTAFFSELEEYQVYPLSRSTGQDLTDETAVREWFANHPADYLINLFALTDTVTPGQARETLFEIPLASLRQFLEVNVTALFSVCREFARQSTAKGIINFSSIYGVVAPKPQLYSQGEKQIGYCVSKGAVLQLSKHLAVHLAPRVRVNTVVLGGVADGQGAEFLAKYQQETPLGRMMAKEELHQLIKFLCSDGSSYMTGSTITVDGGWTTW